MLIKIVLSLAAIYLLIIITMALAQTRLLFPVGLATGDVQFPPGARRLEFRAPDGARLHGIHVPATSSRSSSSALLLGFGGNAWNAETLAAFLSAHVRDHDIVVFHYRGYGPSEGTAGAAALLEDALAVHDHVSSTIAPPNIIAIGLSIGSGPAAYLARHRKIAGAILITPFDSLRALAGDHYWWAPVGLLLRHHMDVADLAAEANVPIAIIAAERDRIVPPSRTDVLRRSVRRLILDRTIANVGHNDIYDHPEFAAALREAVGLIEAKTPTLH
jgi:pimeloyl-ACP methyl ester carboxylesterase